MSSSAAPGTHADNLFGVCHALSEATGVSALLIRLGFALCFILNFALALTIYAACGVAVYFERIVAWSVDRRRNRRAKVA